MYSRREGSLYLEEVRLSRLMAALPTPFYVYSAAELRRCWIAYQQAVDGIDALIGYAIKANHNPAILRLLSGQGAGAIVASELELRHALHCGFQPGGVLMHGNGKRRGDIEAALRAGVLLSVDSPFDLRHVAELATGLGVTAQVLLRVNPDIDAHVHPYIATGMHDSKFGMPEESLAGLRGALLALPQVRVRGLHSHIGSSLLESRPFVDAARVALALAMELRRDGHPVDILDLGGGLGIDYSHAGHVPTPDELLAPLRGLLYGAGLRLILEPGRSLVASAGALLGRVLGVKSTPRKSFIVVDASMAQLIRPSLYGAYHHIELLEPTRDAAADTVYDVVGPLCESGDFLGQGRRLPEPAEGDGVIVYDAGAYGYVMASRYNLNLLPAEYLIDGDHVQRVRRAETWADFAALFADEEVGY